MLSEIGSMIFAYLQKYSRSQLHADTPRHDTRAAQPTLSEAW